MSPAAFARLLSAQAGALADAGAKERAAALEALAAAFAGAGGRSVRALLPEGEPATGAAPGPELAGAAAALGGLRSVVAAAAPGSPALADIDALAAALVLPGPDGIGARIAAWGLGPEGARAASSRGRGGRGGKGAEDVRAAVVERHARAVAAASTPEDALAAIDRLADDRAARTAELRAVLGALGEAAPARAPRARLVERLRWRHLDRIADREKAAALAARGTL
jgi:hypothetical protein